MLSRQAKVTEPQDLMFFVLFRCFFQIVFSPVFSLCFFICFVHIMFFYHRDFIEALSVFCFFPECAAKGSRFKSGGLEVWRLTPCSLLSRFVVVLSSPLRPNRAPCNTGDIGGSCVSGRWVFGPVAV